MSGSKAVSLFCGCNKGCAAVQQQPEDSYRRVIKNGKWVLVVVDDSHSLRHSLPTKYEEPTLNSAGRTKMDCHISLCAGACLCFYYLVQ